MMKRIHRITTLVLFFCTDLHHYYKYRTTRIQVIVHGNLQSMPHKAKIKEGQGLNCLKGQGRTVQGQGLDLKGQGQGRHRQALRPGQGQGLTSLSCLSCIVL